MEKQQINRTNLETLSTADLIEIADDYGIEIPPHLNRRFIIAEILEAEEYTNDNTNNDLQADENLFIKSKELPKFYNETQVSIIMRNPVWCFVYWDIKTYDLHDVSQMKGYSGLVLRVSFFSDDENTKPIESFEISVNQDKRDQYILLPVSEYSFRIDLIAHFSTIEPKVLATSRKVIIPKGYPEISSIAMEHANSPILTLSGMNELISTHYKNHRQSFT